MGLLEGIDGFLRRHGMTPTCFGRLALNDVHLVEGLRRGRKPRPITAARIEGFMRGFEAVR